MKLFFENLDSNPDKAAEKYGCQGFYSVKDMLASGIQIDAVSMATAGVGIGPSRNTSMPTAVKPDISALSIM